MRSTLAPIASTSRPTLRRSALAIALLAAATAAATLAPGPTRAESPAAIDGFVDAGRSASRLDEPPRSLTVLAGGDVLTEERVRFAAARAGAATGRRFDFRPMFAEVRAIVEFADLAICNMEIPIGYPGAAYGFAGRSPYGGNRLVAPYEIAEALRVTGFDRCSTATNHSYDIGTAGLASTLDVLHAHGIGTSGTARHRGEAIEEVFTVNGVRVGHVSYTTFSNTVLPPEPWRVNRTTDPAVVGAAVDALRRGGAEIVVVSIHLSTELLTAPTPVDRSFVTRLVTGSDVDAVFVHGPHVVQLFERVRGTPVWWSLGNFVSEMGPPSVGKYASARTSDGLLAFVRFDETPSGRFRVSTDSVAICNDFADRTVRSATTALAAPGVGARVRAEVAQCLARTRSAIPAVH